MSKLKEEESHEHVVERHPQRILYGEEIVAYERDRGNDKVINAVEVQFVDCSYYDISAEEWKQEPARRVSVEMTECVYVTPSYFRKGGVECRYKIKEWEINDRTYESPNEIGNEKEARSVGQVWTVVKHYAFVEISCLEKEKGHEKEGPIHDFDEPVFASESTHADGVEQYHAEYAKSA